MGDIYYEMKVVMKKEMKYMGLKMQICFQKKSWNGPWMTIWRTPNVLDSVICHLNYIPHKVDHTFTYLDIAKKLGLIFICDLLVFIRYWLQRKQS